MSHAEFIPPPEPTPQPGPKLTLVLDDLDEITALYVLMVNEGRLPKGCLIDALDRIFRKIANAGLSSGHLPKYNEFMSQIKD